MRIQSISDDIVAMTNIRTLKQEREKRGLTQLELSKKAGISSQAVISAIELGVRCKVSDYNKLADLIGWEKYVPCRELTGSKCMERELMLSFGNEGKEAPRRRRQRKNNDAANSDIRIPKEMQKELSLLSNLQEMTVSDIINKVLRDYIAQNRPVIDSLKALRRQLKEEENEE